jgi:F0F1-type ATP synthase assembly protein I
MTWGGMGRSGSRPAGERGSDARQDGPRGRGSGGENAGWTLFSYLIAGMIVYGGLGWLVAHWTGHPMIFPIGMLIGLALGVAGVIYRYGRS